MFYISPQTIPTEQTPVTLMPTTKITPTVESTTEKTGKLKTKYSHLTLTNSSSNFVKNPKSKFNIAV